MWEEDGLHTLSRNGWVTVFGCFDVNALNRGGKEIKVTPSLAPNSLVDNSGGEVVIERVCTDESYSSRW